MSTLTKDEREFLSEWICGCYDDEAPPCSVCRINAIVNRLVAENEELRGKLCKSDIGRLELIKKLTAIIEAAEPIAKEIETNLNNDYWSISLEDDDVDIIVHKSEARNLNKAVKEAKG